MLTTNDLNEKKRHPLTQYIMFGLFIAAWLLSPSLSMWAMVRAPGMGHGLPYKA